MAAFQALPAPGKPAEICHKIAIAGADYLDMGTISTYNIIEDSQWHSSPFIIFSQRRRIG